MDSHRQASADSGIQRQDIHSSMVAQIRFKMDWECHGVLCQLPIRVGCLFVLFRLIYRRASWALSGLLSNTKAPLTQFISGQIFLILQWRNCKHPTCSSDARWQKRGWWLLCTQNESQPCVLLFPPWPIGAASSVPVGQPTPVSCSTAAWCHKIKQIDFN